MKTCTTHHICDCMQEKMSELERRLKQACETIQGALTYDPMIDCYKLKDWHRYMKKVLNELEAPLEEK